MAITINVNGKRRSIKATPDTPLLYVLRDDLHLRGPKFGCGLSQCGACSVLLDGKEIRSCVTPVAGVVGKRVTTLEGLPALYAKQKKLAKPPGVAPVAASVDRRAGSAVWLLPERNDHHGRRAPGAKIAADRRRDQEVDGPPSLSLRHPQRDRAGNQACRQSNGLNRLGAAT